METRENHKIIYNGDRELPLTAAPYPLVIDKERERVVLQMYADNKVTAAEIELLATNTGNIAHYAQTVTVDNGTETTGEWEPKATYAGYNAGVNGLLYSYADGKYNIQLLRTDRLAVKVDDLAAAEEQLQADVAYMSIMTGTEM